MNSRPLRIRSVLLSSVFLFFLQISRLMSAQPQSPVPSNADSRNNIASFIDELGRISGCLQKGTSPEKLTDLRHSLPAQWTVATVERDYAISTEYLRGQLAVGSRENAKLWVDNLATQLSSYSTGKPSTIGNARAELDRILAAPEFSEVRPPTAWDLFRQRLAAWLERQLVRLFGGLARYPISGRILFWVVVVACVGFIALWVFRFTVSRDRLEALPPGHVATVSHTWQEWIRTAREAAGRKDFREAVHCAYWAGITRLEDVGALPKDPTKTPREYLRLVTEPAAPELAPRVTYREPLSVLTSRLEESWYANRGASAEDFRDALRQLEDLGCQLE